MKKFILKVSVWVACIILFFIVLIYPLTPSITANKKRIYIEQYGLKNFDLLVLGSSRAEHSIKPNLFQNNLHVFNAGEAGYGLPSNYFLLKALIEKHHVKIKKILFQLDETAMNGDRGFSRKFRDDAFIEDIDDEEVYEAYKTFRNPFIAAAIRNYPQTGNLIYTNFRNFFTHYPAILQNYSKTIKDYYDKDIKKIHSTKGYVPVYYRKIKKQKEPIQKFIIQKDDLLYLNKLVTLCKKYNIDMVMFRAPILNCIEYDATEFDQFITSFSKQHNIPFLDYKCDYQNPAFYKDNTHIIDSGATLLTQRIIARLNQDFKYEAFTSRLGKL